MYEFSKPLLFTVSSSAQHIYRAYNIAINVDVIEFLFREKNKMEGLESVNNLNPRCDL